MWIQRLDDKQESYMKFKRLVTRGRTTSSLKMKPISSVANLNEQI